MEDIIKNVIEDYFKVKIKKQTRKKEYIEARAFYYKFCRQYTRGSLQSIGETVGKDHACVINGINRLEGWLTYDKRIIAYYNELEGLLREKLEDFDDNFVFIKARELYEYKYNDMKEKYRDLIHKYNFLKSQLKKYQPKRVESGEFDVEKI